LAITQHHRPLKRLTRSKTALALPITFMILLVSTLGIISVTYYIAVERINLQSQTLKVSTAKQDFQSLNDVVLSTLWQPQSSGTIDLADSGGQTNIQPAANPLTINVNDNSGIDETVFSAVVGKITYQLPNTRTSDAGLYLVGDSRKITDQVGATVSQLCIVQDAEHVEIQLGYRPTVTYASGGLQDGKSVNNIRVYIVNLNSSDALLQYGELPLKVSCTSTDLTTKTYDVSYQPEALTITSQLNAASGNVVVPLSSTSLGSIINLEIVTCNVSIERWIR
jgi:hypothetical protein